MHSLFDNLETAEAASIKFVGLTGTAGVYVYTKFCDRGSKDFDVTTFYPFSRLIFWAKNS